MRLRFFSIVLLVALVFSGAYFMWSAIAWLLLLLIPLLLLGIYDIIQKKHAILRNFPVYGHGRWIMEWLRPYIRQYLIESDTDGRPISRMFRSIVYQRAKGELETVPFGTRVDTYRSGYEWIGHSIAAINESEVEKDLRVRVGGTECKQPYEASILNVSAMSFGALSKNAIRALNRGAKLGNFYHNTGEGGISPYHLEAGGDLVWQVGTGYFGCRDHQGNFSAEKFRDKATLSAVKMIEIKLSQGAKPGHGGILPADKNSDEIAKIRDVPVGTQVNSPPAHSTFDSPIGLLKFIVQLRELSDGKPVGFKLAVGRKSEFIAICKAMVETGIQPDFITVDGGEGGTGAAPLEYTNSIGMPLREALAFVVDSLVGYGLREHIRVIASGKILTGFHLVKNMALGADICNSARGMMLALGCVQSLTCNSNRCPTGVATQDPRLYRGLDVTDKAERVRQYHRRTLHATAEIIASAGLHHTGELNRSHIHRRVNQHEIRRYDEIFPYLQENCLRSHTVPLSFAKVVEEARADSWMSRHVMHTMDDAQTV